MFIIDKNNKIKITRGDTAHLKVDLEFDTGEPYVMDNGDVLKFTVKTSALSDDSAIVVQIISTDNEINIKPSDTKNLKFGTYVYDIELDTADGEVYTVVPYSYFYVCEEVG